MNLLPPPARMRQFAPLLLVLASAAIAAAAYLQALNYALNADDGYYVAENTKLAELRLAELWRLFTEPYNIYEFLPLRDLSYWFDIKLFGINPSAFRMHNILLYLLCLPLVYVNTSGIWRYFRPLETASAPWAASAVTALFALHPAHVEAVVWISGRKDVLSAMFSLLALWFAVSARREKNLSAPHAAASLVALLAAMLSKATAVAVAPVIAMLWIIFWRDTPASNRRYPHLLWPLASLLLAVCTTLVFTMNSTIKAPAYFGVEVVTRALAVLGWLARLAISPGSRHFFYPVLEDPYLPVMVASGVAILAAAVAGMVMLLRKRSLEGFALATFLLLCLPYIQLIPYRTPSLAADRWLALAVWPVVLLVVALFWRFNPVLRMALLLAIAAPWCYQTMVRPHDWRNFEIVTDADLRAYPWHHIPAMYKIINSQLPQGLTRDARETANSIADPEFRGFMNRLIDADYAVRVDAIATGKPQEAMALLWKFGLELKQPPVQARWNPAIQQTLKYCRYQLTLEWKYLAEHFPDDVSIRYNTGLWLLNAQKYKEAAVHLRAATESPSLPESVRGAAFKNLGFALLNSGNAAEAETPLRKALEQPSPDLRAYCLLYGMYKQAGRFEEAARAETECRKQAPDQEMAR